MGKSSLFVGLEIKKVWRKDGVGEGVIEAKK